MAISNDNPSTPLPQDLIGENTTLNAITISLDDEIIDNMNNAIELGITLTKLDHSGDYYHAIKQELTHLLAEIGLITAWAYQERLIKADQEEE